MSNEMTAINQLPQNNIDPSVYKSLKTSLYPGASDESVSMIISYCKARKIDPMLKPVHLVPMMVKTGEKDHQGYDKKEWRDVVMPGIGLYRIDAARSGSYAGMSEPEFGSDVTEQLGSKKVTYPKWCKITVKKLVNGQIVEFTAKEFWKENYSTNKKDSIEPNAMWFKRPYGQLAKCAEAQALRKAFPDVVGQEVSGEEMEGKIFEGELIKNEPEKLKQDTKLDEEKVLSDCANAINSCTNLDDLKEVYSALYKTYPSIKQQIIIMKDSKKSDLDESLENDFNEKIKSEEVNE